MLVSLVLVTGCATSREINGKTVEPYGLFNEDARKDPNVNYEVSPGSVIVGIIFCETIVFPVYIVGWDLYAPISAKTPAPKK